MCAAVKLAPFELLQDFSLRSTRRLRWEIDELRHRAEFLMNLLSESRLEEVKTRKLATLRWGVPNTNAHERLTVDCTDEWMRNASPRSNRLSRRIARWSTRFSNVMSGLPPGMDAARGDLLWLLRLK